MMHPKILSPEEALPFLLEAAGRLAQRGRAVVALDGQASAGKTTLAEALGHALPGAAVVHMDDFFLPPEKRTAAYRETMLANADIERFRAELLEPLLRGGDVAYRPYRFHPVPCFLAPVTIPARCPVVLVEGAYCLHPSLWDAYALHLLMTVSEKTQRERILARNGEAMLARFQSEWIPMENRHIEARALRSRCDAVIAVP